VAQPGTTFIILGAVVLCVTGAEALYADLGHFGKRPIRLAWFSVVMPALTLNYFGQGALLLAEPGSGEEPVLPDGARLGAAAAGRLATLATVIASQALITGAFSVTKQVIQLGYLPRLNIQHTSVRDTGQIYMPFVNWGLFADRAGGGDVPLVQQPGGGLRHRGDAGHADHHGADLLRHPLRLEVPAGAVRGATGWFFIVDLRSSLQPAQAVPRRLVPAGHRRHPSSR
jgi:hypothetical protein